MPATMGNGGTFVTFFVIHRPDKTALTRAVGRMIVNVTASAWGNTGMETGMGAGGSIAEGASTMKVAPYKVSGRVVNTLIASFESLI